MTTIKSRQKEFIRNGRIRFSPIVRRRVFPPMDPEKAIFIPVPEGKLPDQPSKINWLTMLLPPLIMMAGIGVYAGVSSQSNWAMMIPFLLMSLSFPVANFVNYRLADKHYREEMQNRAKKYDRVLVNIKQKIREQVDHQKQALDQEYPAVRDTLGIILSMGDDERLWARRLADDDFLFLRIGSGEGPLSFSIELPNNFNQDDPLIPQAVEIKENCQKVSDVPILLNLAKIGSVCVTGDTEEDEYAVVYRLLLDLLAYHSPSDVELGLVSDKRHASDVWEWLKWAPHIRAIEPEKEKNNLALNRSRANTLIDRLARELVERQSAKRDDRESANGVNTKHFVLIVDDTGMLRQKSEMIRLVKYGHEHRISLVFLGLKNTPGLCRARLEVNASSHFDFCETWEGIDREVIMRGKAEKNVIDACLSATRALARLETSEEPFRISLPERYSLVQMIGRDFDIECIKERWTKLLPDQKLLQFPIGVYVNNGLQPLRISLLPENLGGSDAYHTILIGTTGSGKSVLIKSLVLAAAAFYSPRQLNFFFMDFKGGATLNKFIGLPHVTGVVDNLGAVLTKRGISALEREIHSREKEFKGAGVENIWQYNAKITDHPIPHLVVILDEFAQGLKDFPELQIPLDTLVRVGRSLGIYLILANQNRDTAVDKLIPNVGWRIALMVGDDHSQLAMISKAIQTLPSRVGQGYIRHSNKGYYYEFQSALSFLPMKYEKEIAAEAEEFEIYEMLDDGVPSVLHRNNFQSTLLGEQEDEKRPKEEDFLLALMGNTAKQLGLSPTPIYLDPLPEKISLIENIISYPHHRSFQGQGVWSEQQSADFFLTIRLGLLDYPDLVKQPPLIHSFKTGGNNLVIYGTSGSAIDRTIISIVTALAYSHTPDEVQFYVLDNLVNQLDCLGEFPHTGSVIHYPDKAEYERVDRLFKLLRAEMQHRRGRPQNSYPQLFFIINNYGEFKETFSDAYGSDLVKIAQNGEPIGIHLIVTNFDTKHHNLLTQNFSKRLVHRMNSLDDYHNILGSRVQPFTSRLEDCVGRGYWDDQGRGVECQVLDPDVTEEQIKEMGQYPGGRPVPIVKLPLVVPLDAVLNNERKSKAGQTILPIGQNYDDLSYITLPVEQQKRWLITGDAHAGKSNFLASAAITLLGQENSTWEIFVVTLGESPLPDLLNNNCRVHIYDTEEKIRIGIESLEAELAEVSNKKRNSAVLVDNLGSYYLSNSCASYLDQIAAIHTKHPVDLIMCAGTFSEISKKMATPLLSMLLLGAGMCFSVDSAALTAWNIPQAQYRQYKDLPLPPGRGCLVLNSKVQFIQTCHATTQGEMSNLELDHSE